jgi:hypothetical protein
MKNLIQRIAIAWIAILGIIGINKERLGRSDEKDQKTPQQQEVMLDEYEIASFHNS